MYLLYVDAAGTADLTDRSKQYVLVGLCVHEGTWFALEKRVNNLKQGYGLSGVELHVKCFNRSIREQDEVGDWSALDQEDRRAGGEKVRLECVWDSCPLSTSVLFRRRPNCGCYIG